MIAIGLNSKVLKLVHDKLSLFHNWLAYVLAKYLTYIYKIYNILPICKAELK